MTARRNLFRFTAIAATLLGIIQLPVIAAIWIPPLFGYALAGIKPLFWRNIWMWGLPTLFSVLVVVYISLQLVFQQRANRRFERQAITYHIYPRADEESGGCETGTQFWNQVVDLLLKNDHLILSISRLADQGIRFGMTALPETCRTVLHQLLADWPGTQVKEAASLGAPFSGGSRQAENGQPTAHIQLAPSNVTQPLQTRMTDPMLPPLVELSQLPATVEAGILVYVRRDVLTQQRQLRTAQRQAAARKRAAKLQATPQPPTLTEKRADRAGDERADRPFLEVQITVWASAETMQQARAVMHSLAKDVSAQYGIANPLIQFGEKGRQPTVRFPTYAGKPLTDIELGSVMHLLGKKGVQVAPQLATATARNLEPAQSCRIPAQAQLLAPLGAT